MLEIEQENIVFAKALSSFEELFEGQSSIKDLVNTGEIVKKFIAFLRRSSESKL